MLTCAKMSKFSKILFCQPFLLIFAFFYIISFTEDENWSHETQLNKFYAFLKILIFHKICSCWQNFGKNWHSEKFLFGISHVWDDSLYNWQCIPCQIFEICKRIFAEWHKKRPAGTRLQIDKKSQICPRRRITLRARKESSTNHLRSYMIYSFSETGRTHELWSATHRSLAVCCRRW